MRKVLTLAILTASFGLALPATAFAGPAWLLNGALLTGSLSYKASSTEAEFEDTKGALGEPLSVRCSETEEGSVGTEGKGLIVKLTASSCTGVRSCEATGAKVSFVHLSWNVQLIETEKEEREKIFSGGSGAPGWVIECKVLGIVIKDECTGEITRVIENATKGAEGVFDEKTAAMTCTLGGSGTGAELEDAVDEASSGTLSTESSAEGKVEIQPFRWTFALGEERKVIEIVNNKNVEETVTSGGQVKGPELNRVFTVFAGQECYNTNVKYVAGRKCLVTIESTKEATIRQTEELEIGLALSLPIKARYER